MKIFPTPAVCTLLLGISTGPLSAEEKADQELPPCCRNVEPSKPYTDGSVYQLESIWTSDAGKEVRLGVLHGKPQVVAMFFAQCEYACPIIVQDMKKIERSIPAAQRDKVGFILVTFDTDRDTPEVLHDYRVKQKLSNTNWTLLRSSQDNVRELAALLGVNYKKDARGQFAHSNLLTVLTAEGEIVHQHKGLNQSIDGTVEKIIPLITKETSQQN